MTSIEQSVAETLEMYMAEHLGMPIRLGPNGTMDPRDAAFVDDGISWSGMRVKRDEPIMCGRIIVEPIP